MLNHTDLKKGIRFIIQGEPYEVLESSFVFKGRGSSIVQTKIKNLITGNILSRTFHPSDTFEEAEVSKIEAKCLYRHRDKFFFSEVKDPAKRFDLAEEQTGEQGKFLKPNQIVEGIIFQGKIINVSLPIKINFKVIEAPPGVKGDRAEPGTKTITLETGAKINAPLFIKEGDIIEVNTETGEYVRRIE
jgi:elongation factor P